jgi:hypothetical protein
MAVSGAEPRGPPPEMESDDLSPLAKLARIYQELESKRAGGRGSREAVDEAEEVAVRIVGVSAVVVGLEETTTVVNDLLIEVGLVPETDVGIMAVFVSDGAATLLSVLSLPFFEPTAPPIMPPRPTMISSAARTQNQRGGKQPQIFLFLLPKYTSLLFVGGNKFPSFHICSSPSFLPPKYAPSAFQG